MKETSESSTCLLTKDNYSNLVWGRSSCQGVSARRSSPPKSVEKQGKLGVTATHLLYSGCHSLSGLTENLFDSTWQGIMPKVGDAEDSLGCIERVKSSKAVPMKTALCRLIPH